MALTLQNLILSWNTVSTQITCYGKISFFIPNFVCAKALIPNLITQKGRN